MRSGVDPAIVEWLREWAAGEPLIRRVWIFGSRARGDHRAGSDMDIAVEIDSAALPADRDGWPQFLMGKQDVWRAAVAPFVPYQLDLWLYGPTEPSIVASVSECSVLVFERGA